MFYIFGVLVAGLIVPFNHNALWPKNSLNGSNYVGSSPFMIAIHMARNEVGSKIVRMPPWWSDWSVAYVCGTAAHNRRRVICAIGLVRCYL